MTTSTAVATVETPRRSVLVDMATRYGMEPAAFEQTIRATVIKNASKEELAAFLLVAKEYGLNPLTKEIYAFPAKGGGIVPVVSVDGWVNLINSHAASDGFEFDMEHGDDGVLVSCTCRMYRKDRSRPVTITEYLAECVRGTDPWNMKHRMLRHKALIQAARYAFGFSGIYDEDEAERIVAAKELRGEFTVVDDGGGPPNPTNDNDDGGGPPVPNEEPTGGEVMEDGGGPPAPETETVERVSEERLPANTVMGEADDGIPEFLRVTDTDAPKPERSEDEQNWLDELETEFGGCSTMEELSETHRSVMAPYEGSLPTATWNAAVEIMDAHTARIQAAG
jgi:phage recombination protein Bet